MIGYLATRGAYLNTKANKDKLGFFFSLFAWVLALKLLGLGLFVFFVVVKDLFVPQQILEVGKYSIEEHKIVVDCSDKHFDVNRATLEKLAAEQPSGLRIRHWSSGIVRSVQFITSDNASTTCQAKSVSKNLIALNSQFTAIIQICKG